MEFCIDSLRHLHDERSNPYNMGKVDCAARAFSTGLAICVYQSSKLCACVILVVVYRALANMPESLKSVPLPRYAESRDGGLLIRLA